MSKSAIGVIGVGLMGAGMAHRLLAAGHPVHVVAHRNRAPVDALLDRGAQEAPDGTALLDRCDVLLTCLPNADVVEILADALVPSFRAGQIWIDTTTSRPGTSVQLAERLGERDAIFADAPVTGGPPQAEAGTLASLVGCVEQHCPAIEAIVGTYSKTIRRFGAPGSGHAAKLLNNLVTQGTMILLSDAYQCAAKIGVDPQALYDVMMTGAARSGTLQNAVGPALEGNYAGAKFTIANAAKDLRYAEALLAQSAPSRAPLAAVLADRLSALARAGHGDDFVSTMLKPETS
ncbi:NAD(P)-dependent oxidoreductase [Roseobacter sinensis]|uniref:NAD(P)-dependent oxidoreductase n=1 Tax=Roseobacter sinensis TaxID=2931391 RepID=A0ABT3BE37_9RHOB|nr:NAD(P)-dependent oxidoreductase [Roseobacter sp. WL0113]MCV3271841.1 NAD(P)-dependent oxidoreductase [Roseobacter sp. WL0113]